MPYIGTQPKDVRSFGRAKFDFTATQGQTAFTGADDDSKTLGFTDGQIEVYVNGILMDESDFTTSNGNTVTLASAANLNDIISIVAMQTDIPNSDYVPASGGTFTGQTIHDQNILVGKTASNYQTIGVEAQANGSLFATAANNGPLVATRKSSNGNIASLYKDASNVGNIGIQSTGFYMDGEAGHAGIRFAGNELSPRDNGADADGVVSLGESDKRWKDLYLSGGAYIGGTASGNHLDYYEEGTWTPAIGTTNGSTTASLNYSEPYYVRIGNKVTAQSYIYNIIWSDITDGTYIILSGFPFASAMQIYAPILLGHNNTNIVGGYLENGGNVYLNNSSGSEYQQQSNSITGNRFMFQVTAILNI